MKIKLQKKWIILGLTFLLLYFLGGGIALLGNAYAKDKLIEPEAANWGLGFGAEGQQPTGNATKDELKKYDAYYIGDNKDKVIYLTFDAGYENGYTPAILDALKKHNVKVTFFLVGNYISTQPELVKRMLEEGHQVANHTFSHPNMANISSKASFEKELTKLEDAFTTATGQKMVRFYRPPQGKYSVENLKMAQELGYKTFFWSLAYVDWYNDKQPTKAQAFQKLIGRIHPGAIVLLHCTSKTNSEILDELLTKWEEMGYCFDELQNIDQ
ncbi:MAG: putative rane protein [Firmicutes bacterium]|nr:putative rane protein [Bacillota bacterium]